MTKDEIYKKAQKRHQELEHESYCVSAGICPKCGSDMDGPLPSQDDVNGRCTTVDFFCVSCSRTFFVDAGTC